MEQEVQQGIKSGEVLASITHADGSVEEIGTLWKEVNGKPTLNQWYLIKFYLLVKFKRLRFKFILHPLFKIKKFIRRR